MKTTTYDETKFKLVPLEPDYKILVELCHAKNATRNGNKAPMTNEELASIYTAGISAAPAAEEAPQQEPSTGTSPKVYFIKGWDARGVYAKLTNTHDADLAMREYMTAIPDVVEQQSATKEEAPQQEPDCRLCTFRQTYGESDDPSCSLLSGCVNGTGFRPASPIKLWSTK